MVSKRLTIGSRKIMTSRTQGDKIPFLSIITVVYNNEDFIEDCIKSVKNCWLSR